MVLGFHNPLRNYLRDFHSRPKFFVLISCSLLSLLLSSSIIFSAEVRLAWDPDPAIGLTGYKIYCGVSSRTGTDPKSCGLCGYSTVVSIGNVTTYTVNNLTDGQTYYVSVTAYDSSNNESSFSNEVSGVATSPGGTYAYTFATNPMGLQVMVDGTTYTTPQTFSWASGSSHTLSVSSPQSGSAGTQYVFGSWSDGGGQSHTITTSSSAATYTASFDTQYSLTTSINPPAGGTVNPPGLNWYTSGQGVSILATANTGYSFSGWAGGLSGSTNPVSLTMDGPKSITANYTQTLPPPVQYSLTVNVIGSGTVTKNPDKSTYNQGDQVTLTAVANSGYSFGGWSGDVNGMTNPVTLTMNGNKTVTATFTQAPAPPTQYSLTVNVVGSGSVTKNPDKPSYNAGDQVTLTATPGSGYSFSNWSGDAIGTTNPVTLIMNGNKTVTATFTQAPAPPTQYSLTVNVVGSGSVTKNPDKPTYNQGDQVTLTATAASGYSFGSWSGDASGSTNPVTLTMNGNRTVVANFTQIPPSPPQYSLTVNVVGSGSVTKNPDKSTYNQGDQVTLTATANSGYSFGSWSGDASGSANPVTLTMNGNRTVVANFTQTPPAQYTLTVNVNGSGSVSKNPDQAIYNPGDQVTLIAAPDSGYSFGSWSGDASGSANPVTLTMNGNKTVTANFAFSGSLEMTPSNGLIVTGTRGGPFSPSSQSYSIQNRNQIPIKWKVAVKPRWVSTSPTNGSLVPGGTMPIAISINSNARQLTAGSYNGTVVIANSANASDSLSRSITLTVNPQIKVYTFKTNPDGLQMVVDGVPYTAPQTFEWGVGSSHTVEALSPQADSPAMQHVFASWSNRKPQKQTFVAPSSGGIYTANFKTQYTVTTSVNDAMAGTVAPPGTTWVNQEQKVSVTAKPQEGHRFTNWSGDISGSSNPITLTVTGPINLVANFDRSTGQPESDSISNSNTNLPMIGELESPSEGKKVVGLKTIYGWALAVEGVSSIKAFIDGAYLCDIPYGGLREDLKEHYPNYPNAEKGGFALVWNYSSLPPGSHHVEIEIQSQKGEILRLGAGVTVQKLQGEEITQVSPKGWLVPGADVTVDGIKKTYDLQLEWSDESQSFEIIDVYPQ